MHFFFTNIEPFFFLILCVIGYWNVALSHIKRYFWWEIYTLISTRWILWFGLTLIIISFVTLHFEFVFEQNRTPSQTMSFLSQLSRVKFCLSCYMWCFALSIPHSKRYRNISSAGTVEYSPCCEATTTLLFAFSGTTVGILLALSVRGKITAMHGTNVIKICLTKVARTWGATSRMKFSKADSCRVQQA